MNCVSGNVKVLKLMLSLHSFIACHDLRVHAISGRKITCNRGWYLCMEFKIICPLSSNWLLVSFTRSNEISGWRNQTDPLAGESGWTWIRGGVQESAFPATTQLELKNYKYEIHYFFDLSNLKVLAFEMNNGIVCHQ